MKNTNSLILLVLLVVSCKSGENNMVSQEMKKQAMDIATDFVSGKLVQPKITVSDEGKVYIGDSLNCYIIDPNCVFAGKIDDNASTDLMITIDTLQEPFVVPMYHLILNKENDKVTVMQVINSDMRVLGVKNKVITAEVPTHTPESPLYFCSECTDTVEYKLVEGKLVGDEPVRIGD